MSRRDRLSWKTRKKSKRHQKSAGSNWYDKTADPFTMNQDRTHVPTEEYMTGDPSAWAEDPVEDLSDMDGTTRNEIGMPTHDPESWSHKGEDAWGSDGSSAYDNAKLSGREARNVRQAKVRLAKMQRHFEKKALQCVRIAEALLPDADEEVIAQQALDFMPLPDDAVIETTLRLEDLGFLSEAAGAEKEASDLSPQEMLRIMEAEAKGEDAEAEDADEDKGGEDKEASVRAMIAQEIAKAIGKVAEEDGDDEGDDDEEEEESKEAAEKADEKEDEEEADEEDDEEEEAEEKEGKKSAVGIRQMVAEELAKALGKQSAGYDQSRAEEVVGGDLDPDELLDEDLDAMLSDMDGELGAEEHGEEIAELGIELEPQLGDLDSEALLSESDDTLQALMNQNYGVEGQQGKQASSKKKVNQLGRVKEAGSTGSGDELEGLWESAPDVSKVFS